MARTALDTMTVKEAAERYGTTERVIRKRVKQKKIEIRRPDRRIQIVTRSADEWYESTKNRI